jgi:hypothetical protein
VVGQRHDPASLPPGKTQYRLYRRQGGSQGRFGGVRQISPPTGIRFPDRPARSESLYLLSYPGPFKPMYHEENNRQNFSINTYNNFGASAVLVRPKKQLTSRTQYNRHSVLCITYASNAEEAFDNTEYNTTQHNQMQHYKARANMNYNL